MLQTDSSSNKLPASNVGLEPTTLRLRLSVMLFRLSKLAGLDMLVAKESMTGIKISPISKRNTLSQKNLTLLTFTRALNALNYQWKNLFHMGINKMVFLSLFSKQMPLYRITIHIKQIQLARLAQSVEHSCSLKLPLWTLLVEMCHTAICLHDYLLNRRPRIP